MAADHNDRTWEMLARKEPYWAVATWEKFRRQNLTNDTLQEFFQTGVDHIAFVLETIRRHLAPNFKPSSVLDFGCGVGRLLIPLAERCERVVGVDVSDTMLREAQENCHRRGLTNICLLKFENMDLAASRPFDLVHSFIVFQHISPKRGEALFRSLIQLVNTNGIGVFHFTYASKQQRSALRRLLVRAVRRAGGRFVPSMEMYTYHINRLFLILQEHGITRMHIEMTDHNFYGAVLFFQKP
jgi:cyclopropane fatty-acyl-phospholipid synthase-like methyltransferase